MRKKSTKFSHLEIRNKTYRYKKNKERKDLKLLLSSWICFKVYIYKP